MKLLWLTIMEMSVTGIAHSEFMYSRNSKVSYKSPHVSTFDLRTSVYVKTILKFFSKISEIIQYFFTLYESMILVKISCYRYAIHLFEFKLF